MSLLRAVAKEKMPAEWLLYFKTGSLLRAPSFDAEVEVGETLRPFNPHKVGFNGRKNFKWANTWKNIAETWFYFYAPVAGAIWVRRDDVMAIIRRRNALLRPIQFHRTKLLILSPCTTLCPVW